VKLPAHDRPERKPRHDGREQAADEGGQHRKADYHRQNDHQPRHMENCEPVKAQRNAGYYRNDHQREREPPHRARHERAHLLRAQRDDRVHVVERDAGESLGAIGGDVNFFFGQGQHGERVQRAGFGAGADEPVAPRGERPGQPFRHLAARGIPDAQEQNGRHAR